MSKRIFLSTPDMGKNELKYIKDAFDKNYIAPLGENIDKFEESIQNYCGVKYSLALNSGTSAIHLALRCLNIKDGDEVFTSTFTFIGSVAPILYEKAKPFFIDSDYKSWNLDPNLLEEILKKRKKLNKKMPKALIVTHLYGQVADIENIKNICETYKIFLIEDSAESIGATFNGKHSGTFGQAGIYSFNGNKIITTSGGGILISNDKKLIEQAKFLSTQAKENFIYYEHKTFGYNYRMSNIIAGIGRGQMEVLDNHIKRRREIFEIYKNSLSRYDIEFMPELKNSFGNRWLTTILFKNKKLPIKIINALNEKNIESRLLWKPMHLQPIFKNCNSKLNGVSEDLFNRGLCLPSGSNISNRNIYKIIKIIKKNIN